MYWHRPFVCFPDQQAMLMEAGTLIGHRVFLVNMGWIHVVHVLLCCPANEILGRLGGICREKDNCLHVFVILFSAERAVITFALSTNSSNTRHIVFCWQKLCSQRGKFCPQGKCSYAGDCSPSSGRRLMRRRKQVNQHKTVSQNEVGLWPRNQQHNLN